MSSGTLGVRFEPNNVLSMGADLWHVQIRDAFGQLTEQLVFANPAKFPKVNAAGGRALAEYFISREAHDLIGRFGVDRFGQALFFPDAGRPEPAPEG